MFLKHTVLMNVLEQVQYLQLLVQEVLINWKKSIKTKTGKCCQMLTSFGTFLWLSRNAAAERNSPQTRHQQSQRELHFGNAPQVCLSVWHFVLFILTSSRLYRTKIILIGVLFIQALVIVLFNINVWPYRLIVKQNAFGKYGRLCFRKSLDCRPNFTMCVELMKNKIRVFIRNKIARGKICTLKSFIIEQKSGAFKTITHCVGYYWHGVLFYFLNGQTFNNRNPVRVFRICLFGFLAHFWILHLSEIWKK